MKTELLEAAENEFVPASSITPNIGGRILHVYYFKEVRIGSGFLSTDGNYVSPDGTILGTLCSNATLDDVAENIFDESGYILPSGDIVSASGKKKGKMDLLVPIATKVKTKINVFTFVATEEESESNEVFKTFVLYGLFNGQVPAWKIDFAETRLSEAPIAKKFRARNYDAAEVFIFEEVTNLIDKNLHADATTVAGRIRRMKVCRQIETLYDKAKMMNSIFTSRHADLLEKELDGLLTPEEEEVLTFDWNTVNKPSKKALPEGLMTLAF